MRILRDYQNVPEECRGLVLAIGNFDGVHRGHQAVIAEAQEIADRLGLAAGVLTFEPHSREFFAPDAPPFRLSTLDTKAAHLKWLGLDVMVALEFNLAFSQKTAEDFVRDVLVDGYNVAHVVVGYDFIFGHKRQGTTVVLAELGKKYGFNVTVVEPVGEGTVIFSSTAIRECLKAGDPGKAALLLGHWWEIEGPVIEGDKRGRTIGFPTANIPLVGYHHPKLGVYAVRVGLHRGTHVDWIDGVANFGMRPTFDKKDVLLEVHLMDWEGDLYDQSLRVAFVDFIRPEMKFAGIDELTAQIAEDAKAARKILANHSNRQTKYADKKVNS
ncbi:bifunctional riboflavin kinase/FAD synthetase [Sneathiella sp. HT1-7]|jgi:riboflavin kinase/FMN adenylyltransferase|uniref:bifunctional riboflavin kinase/FAD synthetase n=1 Tax=Sneathiella sp. HT1-7 TaxID=2887192 RepID=UPI001D14647A|nr:bifunctional riboflavin kinase/FAD synthetase [Sneathiella sp. HT1-7]MCC3303457.1 bifunctional riboflavin kinase/FAD synthetase [Sneathiella sp. HT1-7]